MPTDSADQINQPLIPQFSLRQLFKWVFFVSVVFALLGSFSHLLRKAQRAAISANSQSPLNQLWVALANYESAHGHLPPAYLADASGKPMHSWRVLILPFIEEQALYDKYRFDEPWNGPNNSKLANLMPTIFCVASEPTSSQFTNIVAVAGKGTAFPGAASTSLQDFSDGRENTILLSEITNSSTPWMAPVDVDLGQNAARDDNPKALNISAVYWRRPHVVFADRFKAYALPEDITPEQLRAFSTIAGGEKISRDEVFGQ